MLVVAGGYGGCGTLLLYLLRRCAQSPLAAAAVAPPVEIRARQVRRESEGRPSDNGGRKQRQRRSDWCAIRNGRMTRTARTRQKTLLRERRDARSR
jgi:hypothetical protein